jgi:predicted glutamine amidotransferase
MCRFLMLQSGEPGPVPGILAGFTGMAEEGRTPEGFRHEDGYGVAWLEDGVWRRFRSPKPLWEAGLDWNDLAGAGRLLVHARNASFPDEKGDVRYNQPFMSGELGFVFNGFMEGVKLSADPPGRSGAEKIFNYLLTLLEKKSPAEALEILARVLKKNCSKLWGMNIGLACGETFYCYSACELYPDYYRLHFRRDGEQRMVSSAPLPGLDFEVVPRDRVFVL